MSESFALAAFLARWAPAVRHDLAASESEPLTLAELLALADDSDRERLSRASLGYPDPRGAPWLRSSIAARHRGLTPEDIVCCAGAQEAIVATVDAILEPGGHAVVVLPIYQPSEQAVTARGAATGVSLHEDEAGWSLDVDRVAAAMRPTTRLIVTNFPNSPTGAQLDRATLDRLVALCRRHGVWLVNDEVYRQTDRAGANQPPTVADLYERGVSVNGLSKGFGLPGLRVGWVACRDREILSRVVVAKSRMSSCLATMSEVLADVALKAEDAILRRNRAIGLGNDLKLRDLVAAAPDALDHEPSRNLAFSFPRYRGPDGCDAFALELARAGSVLVLPGSLWRSSLGDVPVDRVRIGLGKTSSGPALDALAGHFGRDRAMSRGKEVVTVKRHRGAAPIVAAGAIASPASVASVVPLDWRSTR